MTFRFSNLSLLILSLFSLTFVSCSDDDSPTPEPQTITDIAVATDDFSILVEALTKAELAATLDGDGAFTVFAPTNAAFNALFANLGVSGIADLSKETLTPILLYHVVNEEVMSGDLTAGYVSTLSAGPEGTTVSALIGLDGGVSINGSAMVTTADVDASNGVIHIIDEVLLPTNVVAHALNNSDFSTLVAALTRSDLSTDFVATLSADGPFTVFAPTNQAFQDLLDSNASWNSLDDIDAATLEAVLSYHVVSRGNVESTELSDGDMFTTLQGSDITINVGSAVTITDGQGGTSTVVAADVQGSNGIIHAIDAVILP